MSTEWDGGGKFAAPRPVCRKARRLTPDEVDLLITGYQSGKTVYQLGTEFGIHRVTVGKLLKRSGVAMRMTGLDESDRDEITRLRNDGWSYARLGARFGVDPATVRRFLLSG